ncbi:MAG: glycosyltransferase family 39 protein [Anaerolineae bacterium]|nr:glycosyltransferase family 39 protein [Thermoflexales bacterium]MDW8407684.1 glycosyltransferase family 39 protein [Anaerolineae bacterium]
MSVGQQTIDHSELSTTPKSHPIGDQQTLLPFLGAALAGVCVMLFLSVALRQIDLPGLYYDEALDLAPMLDILRGAPTSLLRGIGVSIGGYTWPVMVMDYMGSLNGYLTLPFMLALGPGVLAARLSPILFSAITLLLAYRLARNWFGQTVAVLTALLLAVNPSFIWFSRQGITVTSVMTVFSLGSWLLLDWWRRHTTRTGPSTARQRLTMLAAGVLLGLGLWAKIIFLWWIALLGVMSLLWLLTRPRSTCVSSLRQVVRALPVAAIGFVIGAAPFIYFNLAGLAQGQSPATLDLLFRSLLEPTQYGVDNTNILANLNKRLQDFAVFLNGSYFWFLASVPYGNVFAVPAFVAGVLIGSVLALRRPEWRKWFALIACVVAYLPISAFTVSDLWATHFFLLFPLPQMIVATASVWLAERLTRLAISPRRAGEMRVALARAAIAVALIALPLSRDLWVNERYHADLGVLGGSGRFSDAIYKLASHLEAHGVTEPVALDWGIEKSVRLLTADRVRPIEVFGFSAEPDESFRQQIRRLLDDPNRQYIVLWDRFAVYNRRLAFTQIAESMGRRVIETFIAHERSGLPVYVVLRAE